MPESIGFRKSLGVCLVLLVIVLSLSPVSITPIESQSVSYWVEVDCGYPYALRGQYVALTVKSNSSSPRVQIYDPNNILIYNQVWGINQSRYIPISQTASYGEYTVKAIAGLTIATTWLTVLKIDGWSPILEWPYRIEHKNFNYSFNSDFSLTVENNNDSLSIDFGFLRELKQEFNLDLNPLQNGMNVLLRFTRLNVKVDLDFAFIHSGVKIIINGTIPQARTLSIDVSAKVLRNYLKGLRSGNIVFDWSDIADEFDYADGRLSVHVPKNFHVDPAIFSNGFEEGDFTAWTGTSGTPTVGNTVVHHGTYSMEINAQEYAYKTLASSQAIIYHRFYFRATELPDANNEEYDLCRGYAGGTAIYQVSIAFYTAFGICWAFNYRNGAAWTTAYVAATINLNQWYCVELYWKLGAADGEVHLYIDGVDVQSVSGKDTNDYGNCDEIRNGISSLGIVGFAGTIYEDCVVVDSSYIGPEEEAGAGVLVVVGEFSTHVIVYPKKDTFLNVTAYANTTRTAIWNVSLTLEGGIVVVWNENTTTFSEYADPSNYFTLSPSSTYVAKNATAYTVCFLGSFTTAYPEGYKTGNATVFADNLSTHAHAGKVDWFLFSTPPPDFTWIIALLFALVGVSLALLFSKR